jgi:tRNA A-37 threonylcarbamoyl transferase component Bud32
MHKHKVFYAKLFSPVGVIYIRRDAGARFLQFSKVYRELDGEVHRTACLIIEALNHPDGVHLTPVLSVSGLSARLSTTWPVRAISAWIRRRVGDFLLEIATVPHLCPSVGPAILFKHECNVRSSDRSDWAGQLLVPVSSSPQ